ncbi:hypothetical protein [Streptomyces vilmorinianum]|uniref:hypothetical protein n=1 Tax=Streptomyces vilmorinianum TaxID=3051092 RepID=UPI0010FB4881|nr:hypothetical protein [Streptomyces vilmorinianum]
MRTRIRHGLAAALAVSALSLTAACGGGAAKDDAKKDKSADKPAAEQTTSAAPAPATPLTAAQMKAAVLEAKDLPSGWTASKATSDPTKVTADKPECQPLASLLNSEVEGATMGPGADFKRGNSESELSQQIMTFAGTGAADYTTSIGTALGTCTSFVAKTDGGTMNIDIKKLTAPQSAEEAHAFRMTLNIAELGMKIESNILVARQGTGVTRLAHLADAAGQKEFDTFAKLAGDKLAKAAQS